MKKEYRAYEDLILDPAFQEYVKGSNSESVGYWNKWINDHPEMIEDIEKAKAIILTLSGANKKEVTTDKEGALKDLLCRIEAQSPRNQKSILRYINNAWGKVAAILILALSLFYIWDLSHRDKVPAPLVMYNEIIVPVGEKSQVVLPDGTHIWINSGSRLTYPAHFGSEKREVSLEGEAYFDVVKGRKTFTVNTHDATIDVLGTAFNVKSYPEDSKTQTTVVRGRVKVKSKLPGYTPVTIVADQMAVIRSKDEISVSTSKDEKMYIIEKINTKAITSWKDQLLVFADETFEDIVIKMERWYNIRIRIDDENLKKERYTGKFVNNETVYQVLEAIEITTPIRYKVKKDEIVISRKK